VALLDCRLSAQRKRHRWREGSAAAHEDSANGVNVTRAVQNQWIAKGEAYDEQRSTAGC